MPPCFPQTPLSPHSCVCDVSTEQSQGLHSSSLLPRAASLVWRREVVSATMTGAFITFLYARGSPTWSRSAIFHQDMSFLSRLPSRAIRKLLFPGTGVVWLSPHPFRACECKYGGSSRPGGAA